MWDSGIQVVCNETLPLQGCLGRKLIWLFHRILALLLWFELWTQWTTASFLEFLSDNWATVENTPFPSQYFELINRNLNFLIWFCTYQGFANCSQGLAVAIPYFDNTNICCCKHMLVLSPEREMSKKDSCSLSFVEGITVVKQKCWNQSVLKVQKIEV